MKKANYKEMVKFFEDKGISVIKKDVHDPQSGWSGTKMLVRDKNGFLNGKDWTYTSESTWGTIDLASNGYCFRQDSINGVFEKIKKFYSMQEMETFEDFSVFVDSISGVAK